MTRYSKRSIALAVALSALAGYVDARGFLSLGGNFVSFMSGNSTRLGISLAKGNLVQAAVIAGIIATFVAGVVLGSLLASAARSYRPPVVLALVSGLLALAAAAFHFGFNTVGYEAMILSMGAENVVFQAGGEVSIGLTYMTGTLVKMGQRIAGGLTGRASAAGWLPHACLWLGMIAGAVLGASFSQWRGLWLAAFYAAVLSLVALCMRRHLNLKPQKTTISFPNTHGVL